MRKKSTMGKLRKISKLRDEIESCEKCGLSVQRIHVVMGSGSVNANIMLIGEAPGQDEDRVGEPFVGQSGKKLMVILNALGAKRTKMYITNIIKCRPPYNRVPLSGEIKHCISWLRQEIEIIKPRVIVPLGATAMKNVFDIFDISYEGSITANRGEKFIVNDIVIFPTFHPSYVLRHRQLARTVREDIQRAIKYARRKRS